MQPLSIGRFSRLTHLSIKTLREYHEVGLLVPAAVDRFSGYRFYDPGQAHAAHLVERFRDFGLPVADVKVILASSDRESRDKILAEHLDPMREQLRQTESAVASLRIMLQGPSAPVDSTQRVLQGAVTISLAAEVTSGGLVTWWWDAIARLHALAAEAALEQPGRSADSSTTDRSWRRRAAPGSTYR